MVTETRVGWIGTGRMGYPMVERLLAAGYPISVFNRTRAKAEALSGRGGTVVDKPADLAALPIVFTMVATGRDLEAVLFGEGGLSEGDHDPGPRIVVDCSSIGNDQSAAIRSRLAANGVSFLAAPVSGNNKCVRAGQLSIVASGPPEAYKLVEPLLNVIAGRGSTYVGEDELARFCKIAHNLLLGVLFEGLVEVLVLAEKAGLKRYEFLSFINSSVVGSVFTRYKTPALVNLDFAPTFTPQLLLKDLDLGLSAARSLGASVPMVAAAREMLQAHVGLTGLQDDPEAPLAKDFAALLVTVAALGGLKLESENRVVSDGLALA